MGNDRLDPHNPRVLHNVAEVPPLAAVNRDLDFFRRVWIRIRILTLGQAASLLLVPAHESDKTRGVGAGMIFRPKAVNTRVLDLERLVDAQLVGIDMHLRLSAEQCARLLPTPTLEFSNFERAVHTSS